MRREEAAGSGASSRPGSVTIRVIRVMRAAGSRTSLRRVIIAYAAFEVVDLAIWIVLLVYGYEHGGVTGNIGLAAGALLARGLIAWGGARGALYGLTALAAVALVVAWRPLRSVDADATVPQVEVRLLRPIPIFRPLPAQELEGVARQLVRQEVSAGTAVVSEGERGDRWYVVGEGSLRVSRDGVPVATLGRGDGFGEIALVRGVPRSATVIADTDALVYSLDEPAFQLVLTRYAPARAAAERLVDQRLPSNRDGQQ